MSTIAREPIDVDAERLANTRHRQRRQRNSSNSLLATTHCRLDAAFVSVAGCSCAARPLQSVNGGRLAGRVCDRCWLPLFKKWGHLSKEAARAMSVGSTTRSCVSTMIYVSATGLASVLRNAMRQAAVELEGAGTHRSGTWRSRRDRFCRRPSRGERTRRSSRIPPIRLRHQPVTASWEQSGDAAQGGPIWNDPD